MKIKATAYHEAGHAIAAYTLQIPMWDISIEADKDYLGYLLLKYPKWFQPDIDYDSRTSDFVKKRIMVALAGREAEKIITGRYNNIGAESDLNTVREFAMRIISDPKEIEAYIKWLRLSTINLLKVPYRWKLIETLAEELLQRKHLKRKEVREVINNTMNDLAKR